MKNALWLVALLFGAGCGESNGNAGGSCGTQACGGDLVGTWKATSACVDEAALSKLVLGSYASCSGTSLSQVKATPYGEVTFGSDLTYTISLSMDLSFQLNIPQSCFNGGDCSSADNQFLRNLTGTQGVGSVACGGDTSCMCNQVGELNFGQSGNSQASSGTYAISGTTVNLRSQRQRRLLRSGHEHVARQTGRNVVRNVGDRNQPHLFEKLTSGRRRRHLPSHRRAMSLPVNVAALVVLLAGAMACSSGSSSTGAGGASGAGGGSAGTGAAGSAGAGVPGGVGAGGVRARDAAPYDTGGPGSATAQFTLVYNGTLTSLLPTCFDCTGLYATAGYAVLMLAMENSAGAPNTTIVNLQINPGSQGATYAVTLDVVEYNPTLAAMYQGVYGFAKGVDSMNIGPGSCVTFSNIDLAPHGNVSGSVDCDLTGRGVGNAQQAAHLTGTFGSVFPE
jgi:hypothetical protein